MSWIKDFYSLQYKLLGKPVLSEDQEERLALLVEHAQIEPGSRLLEIGAGNGEFAITAAKEGYQVTMVELLTSACESAKTLAKKEKVNSLTIVNESFYEFSSDSKFDAICYWDGFGVGEDADQQQLMQNMRTLVNKGTRLLVDVYTPWYWSKLVNKEFNFENGGGREYDYNFVYSQMIDCWWEKDKVDKVCQYLRCYSPVDLNLILANTGFQLIEMIPSGYVDDEGYHTTNDIGKSMSYTAVLEAI